MLYWLACKKSLTQKRFAFKGMNLLLEEQIHFFKSRSLIEMGRKQLQLLPLELYLFT